MLQSKINIWSLDSAVFGLGTHLGMWFWKKMMLVRVLQNVEVPKYQLPTGLLKLLALGLPQKKWYNLY